MPSRDADIRAINLLLWGRQTGKITDKLWKRMMERNPKMADHFSDLKPIPAGAQIFQLREPVNVRGNVGGTPVYRADECTGPVINGKCHGSIIPKSAVPQRCYGTMLNGQCTGPQF
jgi:hypothetical protein